MMVLISLINKGMSCFYIDMPAQKNQNEEKPAFFAIVTEDCIKNFRWKTTIETSAW